MRIRIKTDSDVRATASVVLECFRDKYLALCGGDETAMEKIALEEMKWRGSADNIYLAEAPVNAGPGKYQWETTGAMELLAAGTRTVPEHVFMEMYMKHLGIGAGLKGVYLLSILGRAVETGECAICQLGVMPEYRRRGIARALLAEAKEYAGRENLDRLSLWVDACNAPAIRLYESEGFEVVEVKKSGASAKHFGIPEWHKMACPVIR